MKFLITFISIDITVDDSHLTDLLRSISISIRHDTVCATQAMYTACESIGDIESTYERERNYVGSDDQVMHPSRKIRADPTVSLIGPIGDGDDLPFAHNHSRHLVLLR